MFGGIFRHLFGGAYAALLLLVILSTHHGCSARKNSSYCAPSSCGNIHTISYPFRLNTDPESCGNKNYELACENNMRPTLYLNMVKYYVLAINYSDFTIRLVEAGVQQDDCFSIPRHSIMPYTSPSAYYDYNIGYLESITFICCQNQVLDPPPYILDTSSCKNGSRTAYNSSSSSSISSPSCIKEGHSYVIVDGHLQDLPDLCRINLIYGVLGFLLLENMTNMSYIDVHHLLVHGFELSWLLACCDSFKENRCNLENSTSYYYDCYNHYYKKYYAHTGTTIRRAIDGVSSIIRAADGVSTIRRAAGFLANCISAYLGFLAYCIEGFLGYFHVTISSYPILEIVVVFLAALVPASIAIYRVLLFLCGLPCFIILLVYKWRKRHLSMYDNIEKFLQSHDNDLMPVRYSYSDIKKITNGFKDKLGEGGFGLVYKGKLRSGGFAAVKILSKSKANGQDFINEVATIGRIYHVNVVRLIGFTVEGSKRALIYELMPNGSLDKYIISRQGSISLSNEKMYEISLGVARGIEYLHQGCDMQILHFDIKPHNILLDEKFIPKLSDFGLAKLYPTDNSIVPLTAARGTIGYMAPELFYKNIGGVSHKSDVYSFGMLLMEMIGRRKNLNALADHSSQIYFPSWIYDQVSEGKDVELGDHATEQGKETTKKMIIVALWCIQLRPNDRPSMHNVVKMLESDVESLQMPPKPFLTPHHMPKDDDKANPIKLSNPPSDCIDSSYQFGR